MFNNKGPASKSNSAVYKYRFWGIYLPIVFFFPPEPHNFMEIQDQS